jgi:drug/metabolite transporter (DMT)-like permease
MKDHSAYETTTWASVFGMFMFGGTALFENKWEQVQWNSGLFWLLILILALFVTVVSFVSFFYAINRIGATKTGIFINLVPVFGTVFSWLILEEPISFTLLLGLALISAGIILINFPSNKKESSLSTDHIIVEK